MLKLGVYGFIIVSLFEPFFIYLPFKNIKTALAIIIIFLQSIFLGFILSKDFNVWALLILYFSCYRVINLLRLVEKRHNSEYLSNVIIETSTNLIIYQLLIFITASLSVYFKLDMFFWKNLLLLISLLSLFIFLYSTYKNLKDLWPKKLKPKYDLPSVSVAIPARNETIDLEDCLKSLVMSDYEKLEILVYDDCSQNKRTPEIIKEFAHEGVRFISGKTVPENWLAKNYAYNQLSRQASGDILIFCGVDTRFSKSSVSQIINQLEHRKLTMLSILPANLYSTSSKFRNLIIQPLRYAWELALPRWLLNRPPVLSTCWAIYKIELNKLGGFKAVANTVSIESYFARNISSSGKYSLLISNEELNLLSNKTNIEQKRTAVRLRYPQTHRKPEIVSLLSLAEFTIFIGPIIIVLSLMFSFNLNLLIEALISLFAAFYIYICFVLLTIRTFSVYTFVCWPIVIAYDIYLLNTSMWKYEFSEVIWKERNICLPISDIRN